MAKKDGAGGLGASDRENYRDRQRELRELKELQKEITRDYSSFLNIIKETRAIKREIRDIEQELSDLSSEREKIDKKKSAQAKKDKELLDQKILSTKKELDLKREIAKQNNIISNTIKAIGNTSEKWVSQLGLTSYLFNEVDQTIRDTAKNIGLAGVNANALRKNIAGAQESAVQFGSTVGSIADIQASYSDFTSQARSLNSAQLSSLAIIKEGTGISAENAGLLGGQFDLIGKNAQSTMKFVEETFNMSEKGAINANRVLTKITQNMGKLQQYNFKNGIRGLREMVMFSDRMKMNIDEVFGAIDSFSNLESAVETAAILQTMGGGFAKADPFQMGFLARNKPEEFAKQMNKMLEGITTFSDKSGEVLTPSAVNMDRLRIVAKQTGQSVENLVTQAKELAKMKRVGRELIGFSDEEKSLVSQLAKFNEEKGVFEIDVQGRMMNIRDIGQAQLEILKGNEASLEQRAKESMGFNKQLAVLVEELKSGVLPLLEKLNIFLTKMREGTDTIRNLLGGTGIKILAQGLLAFGGLNVAVKGLKSIFGGGIIGGGKSMISGMLSGGKSKGGSVGGSDLGGLSKSLGAMPSGKQLMAKAAGIAAIGVAAAGIGAGIYLGAKGISSLALSLKDLNSDQLTALGIGFGVLTASIAGLTAAAMFFAPAAGPLLAFGASVTLIGAGIGIAAAGVGMMAEGFSKLNDPNIGTNLVNIGKGLSSMSLAFLNPLMITGIAGLSALSAMNFDSMNNAFYNASEFLKSDNSNLNELKETLKMISNIDTSGLSKFVEALSNTPLKVEFADGQKANLQADITLNLDRKVLIKELNLAKEVAIQSSKIRRGNA